MNISRDTAIAFALDGSKARKTMQTSIYCRYDDNSIYATTLRGSEFRILAIPKKGEVYLPTYHRTIPPSIHWSTL